MVKKFAIGGAIVAVLGVGGYFVAPVIAQNQAESALDAYFNNLPEGQNGSYENLKVDLWAGTASLDRWTQTIAANLPIQGPSKIIATVSDIKFSGLTLASLSSLKADGDVKQMAGKITWERMEGKDAKTEETVFSTRWGEINGLSGDHLMLARTDMPAQVTVQSIRVDVLGATLQNGEKTKLNVLIDELAATEVSANGFKTGALRAIEGDLTITGKKKDDGKPGQVTKITKRLEEVTFSDLTVGEKTIDASAATMNQLDVNLGPGKLLNTPSVHVANLVVENPVYSRRYFQNLLSLTEVLKSVQGKTTREREGILANHLLTAFEHLVADKQGVLKSDITDFRLYIPRLLTFSFDKARIENSYGLTIGSVMLEGVRQLDPQSKTELAYGRLTTKSQDYSGLPGHIRALAGPNFDQLDKAKFEAMIAAGDWSKLLTDLDFGTTEVSDYEISIRTPELATVKIKKAGGHFRIKKSGLLDMALFYEDAAVPTSGFKSQVRHNPQMQAILKRVGDALVVDMNTSLSYNLADNVLDVRNLGVGAERLGKAAIMTRLTLPPLAVLQASGKSGGNAGSMIVMSQTMLHKTRIRVQDDGLMDIYLAKIAGKQGLAVADVRRQFAGVAKLQGQQMGSPRAAELGDALSAFLTSGGGLEIDAGINEPQPLLALMAGAGQPAAVLDLLKVTAKHLPTEQ